MSVDESDVTYRKDDIPKFVMESNYGKMKVLNLENEDLSNEINYGRV